jgi:hypothetical protein
MRTNIPVLARGLLAAWLIWLALPAGAVTIADLYETEVPVAGEDVGSRNQAIGQALAQVLIKLTGRDPAPGAAALATQAPSYVQQYRFRRGVTAAGDAQIRLWVRFDKLGLDRALRERGLPLWGSSRPGLLVWLGAELAGRRELVGADAGLAQSLSAAAAARGLPVQWPLLDLEDQARLTTADLWSDYAPAVAQASARYSQPLVLAGRLRQVSADHWEGRWTLYEAGQSRALSSSGADGSQAVAGAVGQVAELLAARYAPAGGQNGPELVRLQINGVDGVRDYARVLALVGDREVVDRVVLRRAEGDSLLLEVLARGGRDALAQVLDLVRELSREPDPLPPMPSLPPQPAGALAAPAPLPPSPPGASPVVDVAPLPSITPPDQGPIEPLIASPAVAPAPLAVDLVYRVRL